MHEIDKKLQKSSARLNDSIEKLSQDKDKADIKKPFLEQVKEGLQEIGNILLEIISFIRDLLKSDFVKGLSSDSTFQSVLTTIDSQLGKVDEMISSFMPSVKPSL